MEADVEGEMVPVRCHRDTLFLIDFIRSASSNHRIRYAGTLGIPSTSPIAATSLSTLCQMATGAALDSYRLDTTRGDMDGIFARTKLGLSKL
jgi:hypothetical protein